MSIRGILILIIFIFLRLLPEIITMSIAYDAEYMSQREHGKFHMFFRLAAVSSGFHFLVYLLLYYRSFHSWNFLGTILSIARGCLFYQSFAYFSESFLLCMIAAAAMGIGLRLLMRRRFSGIYGRKGLSGWRKAVVLLSVSVTIVVSILCYEVKTSGMSRLVINEICSKNSAVFLDEEETVSDYVELYNCGWLPYFISEIYLSDDVDNLEKYELPSKVLKPGEYQVIRLDEKAPFQISDLGETLYLSHRGQIFDQVDCIALDEDCSYSRISDGEAFGKYGHVLRERLTDCQVLSCQLRFFPTRADFMRTIFIWRFSVKREKLFFILWTEAFLRKSLINIRVLYILMMQADMKMSLV